MSIGVFLVVILLLGIILLVARIYGTIGGNVKLTIKRKGIGSGFGSTLLNTLSTVKMGYSCHLLVVVRDLADSANAKYSKEAAKSYLLRVPHFSRKQQQDHWRLGCQVKSGNMSIKIDESVLA